MENFWWILAIVLFGVLVNYIGLRGVIDSYRKNPSSKIFYIIGLFSILYAGWYFWNREYTDNKLIPLIVLFAITMVYTFIWKRSGYSFGTERYENTAAAKVVKFFGVVFILVTSVFLLFLVSLWAGWIKFPDNAQTQNQVANSKTYTSIYGFEFLYPSDWEISTDNSPTSSIPVTNFDTPYSDLSLLILRLESNCCREGLVKFKDYPYLLDGKNLQYTVYGYAQNLGLSTINPNNTVRIAILKVPPSLLKNVDRLNDEGVAIELLFNIQDQERALNEFNQIFTTFKFVK